MGFFLGLVSHLRLTWRLFWHGQVHWWQRSVFLIPLIYLLVPFRYDVFADWIPFLGLMDDWLLVFLCSYVFVAICPRSVVHRLRLAIMLSDPDTVIRERTRDDAKALGVLLPLERFGMYRHPQDPLSLAFSFLILALASALGGIVVTVAWVALASLSYIAARLFEARVLRQALPADKATFPKVWACLDRCMASLPYVAVNVFVHESDGLEAYTFGLEEPYTIVLGSRLVEELDVDELTVVIGHELGHALYEHAFFSSLLGGMLYRTGLASFLWALIFFRWRRFAELTADRVSLLACGKLETCVGTLVRLATGLPEERVDVRSALSQIRVGSRGRGYGRLDLNHPYLVTRIQALTDFDAELVTWEVEEWLAESRTR